MIAKKVMKLSGTAMAVLGVIALGGCLGDTAGTSAKPGVVSGIITGFGSVFIDGVEYETDAVSVDMDGTTVNNDSGLKLGMFITLEGTVNPDGSTGVAKSIKFADDVEGLVQSKTLNADGSVTLVVMGQTVTVDADTVFESSVTGHGSAADVGVGNIVEVSGYSSGDGSVHASRLEVKKDQLVAGDEMELKGNILAVGTNTIKIGEMTIDFSSAELEGITLDANAVGKYVEVKSTAGLDANGQLIASKVEVKNGGKKGEDWKTYASQAGGEQKEFKLQGVITAAADGKFELNGQPISFNSETEIKHGGTADLIAGAKVLVEVKLDSNGNLVAEEIKMPEGRTSQDMLMGLVESVDVANKQFTVMGKTITVTNFTRLNDEDAADGSVDRYFNVDKLAVDDFVKVRAYENADGTLVAAKLERKTYDANKPLELKGIVEAVNGTTLTVNGVRIDIAAISVDPSTVEVGSMVKVKGTYESGVFTAAGESEFAPPQPVSTEGTTQTSTFKMELDD